MARYYCSGFDIAKAFGHGLGEMFRKELSGTGSIVFLPGGAERVEKAKNKTVPVFLEHLKNVGIEFEKNILITPYFTKEEAKEAEKSKKVAEKAREKAAARQENQEKKE